MSDVLQTLPVTYPSAKLATIDLSGKAPAPYNIAIHVSTFV